MRDVECKSFHVAFVFSDAYCWNAVAGIQSKRFLEAGDSK